MSAATVGRDDELAVVASFVEDARRGRGAVMLIEGEAGIGKSHLLQATAASARAARLDVLEASAREIEREVPFAPVVEALGAETRKSLARLVPEGGEVGPELRFKLLEFLLDALEESLLARPAVLLLDDLQWADPSTLLVLDRVARSLSVLPLGLAIAFREAYPGLQPLLSRLESVGAVRLQLSPLAENDVLALAGREIGGVPGPRLREILAGAAGNPLYVLETLAAVRPRIDGRDLPPGEVELGDSLYQTILTRLAGLGEETLSLLTTASVLGTRFDLDDLSLVSSLSVPQLLQALEEPMRMAIVRSQGEALGFRHELIRDALYRQIPEGARPALHRDVARRLAQAGRPSSEIASHLLLSARSGDEDAVRWLRLAAREAAPQAPSVAVQLLTKATEIAGDTHADRYEMKAELARALLWARRPSEAEEIARALLAEGRGAAREGRVRRLLVDALFIQARLAESLAEVEALIADDGVPPVERAGILARASGAFVEAGDLERGSRIATEALELADVSDDDASRSVALGVLTRIASRRDGVVDLATLERAARIALSGAGPEAALEAIPALAHTLARYGGRTDESLRLLAEGTRLAERGGHAWALGWMHASTGAVLYHAGRLEDALSSFELVPEAVTDAARLILPLGLAYLGYIEALRDDLPTAERHIAQAEEESNCQSDRNLTRDFDVTWARALVCELAGRDEEAIELLERLRGQAMGSSRRNLLVEFVWYGLAEARIAARAGRDELAEEAARTVADGAALVRRVFPVQPWTGAFEALCLGISTRDAAPILAAREALRSTGRPLLLATACEEAGRVLMREGSREAVPLLEEARQTWAAAGAHRKQREVAATLRELGVRPAPPAATARPSSGWGALTPTESQVAKLVTEGLTYRQIADVLFVSRRTVETHVAHIFEKVGVSSRAELAAQALRPGWVAD